MKQKGIFDKVATVLSLPLYPAKTETIKKKNHKDRGKIFSTQPAGANHCIMSGRHVQKKKLNEKTRLRKCRAVKEKD